MASGTDGRRWGMDPVLLGGWKGPDAAEIDDGCTTISGLVTRAESGSRLWTAILTELGIYCALVDGIPGELHNATFLVPIVGIPWKLEEDGMLCALDDATFCPLADAAWFAISCSIIFGSLRIFISSSRSIRFPWSLLDMTDDKAACAAAIISGSKPVTEKPTVGFRVALTWDKNPLWGECCCWAIMGVLFDPMEAYDVSTEASSSSIGVMGTTGVDWSLLVESSALTNAIGLHKHTAKNVQYREDAKQKQARST